MNIVEELFGLGVNKDHLFYIIEGVKVTLQYSVSATCLGIVIGSILAVFKISNNIFLKNFSVFYTSIFRGTPLIVQLSIIYFAIPNLLQIKLPLFIAGVIAFSLNSGAYISEIIRMGINSIDKGQAEAAKALGIPPILCMKDIILPQAIRNIIPSLTNECIDLIKESAIVSIIGGEDLMRRAYIVSGETYNYFGPMIIAAILYYIMILIISAFVKLLEKKLAL